MFALLLMTQFQMLATCDVFIYYSMISIPLRIYDNTITMKGLLHCLNVVNSGVSQVQTNSMEVWMIFDETFPQ